MKTKQLTYLLSLLLFPLMVFAQEDYTIINSLNPITDSLSQYSHPLKEVNKIKYNLYFDTRADYQKKITNDNTDVNTFNLKTARFFLTSSFSDKVDLTMRYSVNDAPSNGLEFAYLTFHLDKKWSLDLGKLITAWGTYEIDYNGADLYTQTMVTEDLELCAPGVGIEYKTANQAFYLQTVKVEDQFANKEYTNKALGHLFQWRGSFWDNKFETRYGYSLMQHDKSKYYNWVTLGNRFNAKNMFIELDWMYGERLVNYSSYIGIDDNGTNLVKDNAISLSSKYHFDQWNPYVKLMYNKREDLHTQGSYNILSAQAAVEYYPFDTKILKDIRFFLAYNFKQMSFENELNYIPTKNNHEVFCGVRWLIPLASK
ncbi:MAG: OprO/OprP family phosphate-selective porin [Flavobacteriaceae bacterium]|jgi:hypothetical protein|nr:OprO/OprP family phosphate-selective porin [Flavobacteriaceae bacterium]